MTSVLSFYAHHDIKKVVRRTFPGLTDKQIEDTIKNSRDISSQTHWRAEATWKQIHRPYYEVYSSVLPLLTRLDTSRVTFGQVPRPQGLDALLLKFQVGNELVTLKSGKVKDLETVLVWFHEHYSHDGTSGISLVLDWGEKFSGEPIAYVNNFPRTDKPIWQAFKDLPLLEDYGDRIHPDSARKIFALTATICLLDDCPELIEPEVLARDKHRVTPETLEHFLNRARNRGRYCFSVGKHLEQTPHYRRPHLYLQAYGPGHSLRRIAPRKGSLVHRNKITTVPTGEEE